MQMNLLKKEKGGKFLPISVVKEAIVVRSLGESWKLILKAWMSLFWLYISKNGVPRGVSLGFNKSERDF